MSVKVQSAFSAGEIDPALWERTDLAKYRTGLKTARNICIHKTGRAISRQGRKFFAQTKLPNSKVKLYSPPNTGFLLEFGNLYVRVYSINSTLSGKPYGTFVEFVSPFITTQFDLLNFTTDGKDVWCFCPAAVTQKFNPVTGFYAAGATFFLPPAPTNLTATANNTTGYPVDYAVTLLNNGQESPPYYLTNSGIKVPINVGENVVLDITAGNLIASQYVTAANIYRRPTNGGAYGFIGTTSNIVAQGGINHITFNDIGGAADYTHSPPVVIPTLLQKAGGPVGLLAQTGLIFQQRLLLVDSQFNRDAIYASRVGFTQDFTQDYPINSASGLALRCGTYGNPTIFAMIENDGINVFTNYGLFLFTGTMSPDDLVLTKKGQWIIDPFVPPLAVPGGVLFLDRGTNSVRILTYSTEAAGYLGEELSTYSNHLFQSKKVTSWAFQTGELPLIWMSMADGTFISFSYVAEQDMRAWTRHDSATFVEQVCQTTENQITAFVTVNNGIRTIELTNPRYTSSDAANADPNWMIAQPMAAMDAITTVGGALNILGGASAVQTIWPLTHDPVNPLLDNWSGPLQIQSAGSGIFAGITVGQVLRFFDTDYSSVDLKVLAVDVAGTFINVQPAITFPSNYPTNPLIYPTYNQVTGLGYMEGEFASVIVDGYVFSSPNNDDQNYPVLQVQNGTLTLPNGMVGAIIHVGRAITFDIETLDIETVEQRPVLIESKILNKLYIKTLNTSGLYAGVTFPTNNNVAGMNYFDEIDVNPSDQDTEVIGNAYQKPTTKRIEVSVMGDWSTNGRMCLRQVDPLHFELLSLIPDLNDLRRG